jgi:two-component system response regulator
VEDDGDGAELTLLALRRNNIHNEVVVIRDGAEALDYLFGTGAYSGRDLTVMPGVILLDLTLPKVDGLEVLRRLRSDPRTQFLAVVIFTASRRAKDITEIYRLGVSNYICKPIDFAQFVEVIGQINLHSLLNVDRSKVGG